MKKVLFVKDCRRFEAGSIYKAEKSPACAGVIRIYQSNNELSSLLESDPAFKEVETFEHNGEEWIKHDVGACPVPDDWVVCVMVGNETDQILASSYYWGECGSNTIDAYRVISTNPEEKPAPKAVAWDRIHVNSIPITPIYRGVAEGFILGSSSFGFKKYTPDDAMKDHDERPPSPQELAFAAKHPEPEQPKPLAFPDVKLNDNFSCHVGGKWG